MQFKLTRANVEQPKYLQKESEKTGILNKKKAKENNAKQNHKEMAAKHLMFSRWQRPKNQGWSKKIISYTLLFQVASFAEIHPGAFKIYGFGRSPLWAPIMVSSSFEKLGRMGT